MSIVITPVVLLVLIIVSGIIYLTVDKYPKVAELGRVSFFASSLALLLKYTSIS
jgi:hypothetical protein